MTNYEVCYSVSREISKLFKYTCSFWMTASMHARQYTCAHGVMTALRRESRQMEHSSSEPDWRTSNSVFTSSCLISSSVVSLGAASVQQAQMFIRFVTLCHTGGCRLFLFNPLLLNTTEVLENLLLLWCFQKWDKIFTRIAESFLYNFFISQTYKFIHLIGVMFGDPLPRKSQTTDKTTLLSTQDEAFRGYLKKKVKKKIIIT